MPDGHNATHHDQIAEIVERILAFDNGNVAVSEDQDLHECGLTSINMVNLMLAIENEFNLTIPKNDLHPDNFRTLSTINALVTKLANH